MFDSVMFIYFCIKVDLLVCICFGEFKLGVVIFGDVEVVVMFGCVW